MLAISVMLARAPPCAGNATAMRQSERSGAMESGAVEFEERWRPSAAMRVGESLRASADGKLWIVPDATAGCHALLPGAGTVRDWEKFYHGKLGTAALDLLGDYYTVANGPVLSLQRIAVVHGDSDEDLTLMERGALSAT